MTNMLTPEMARMALAFLDRSSMQGAEVQAFLRVQVALQAIAIPPPEISGDIEVGQPLEVSDAPMNRQHPPPFTRS